MRQMRRLVMDPELNPLASLPRAQRFQIMVILSVMWSAIFSAAAGLWFYYGALVMAHLLVLLGIFATGFTFRSARKTGQAPERSEVEAAGRH